MNSIQLLLLFRNTMFVLAKQLKLVTDGITVTQVAHYA